MSEQEQEQEQQLAAQLAAPFPASEIHFKPQAVSGNRALAIPYINARTVQDRLDAVCGVMGWQDAYETLSDGSVMCRLSLRLGKDDWITKVDVGSQSEQPDEGDRHKAAFSDALKRAAVKFGVGRYLYRLQSQWVDYDPQKRQLVRTPTLPPHALPGGQVTPVQTGPTTKPATKKDVFITAVNYELKLVAQGLCKGGELLRHLEVELGFGWQQETSEALNKACQQFLGLKKADQVERLLEEAAMQAEGDETQPQAPTRRN